MLSPGLGSTTVTADVPLWPSLVAVIVAEPVPAPVTRPLELTVATLVLPLDHVTVRPDSGLPLASFGAAVSCTVWPVSTLADAGLTVTDATGTLVTVMADVPICPSLVAVIVAEPAAAPVTRPLLLTVATAPLLVVQLTARPDSGLPLASLGVAVSCVVRPVDRLADAGVTLTDATGTLVTLMAEVALWLSLVAVIVAEPAAPPVTSPLELTVATVALLVDQFTARPDSGFPLASLGVAVSCTVWPVCSDAEAGLTLTDATGTALTVTAEVPVWPSLVALTVAAPAVTPVTTPLPFTVATAASLVDQFTTRPDNAFPLASWGVAVSCTPAPISTLTTAGVTSTCATGSCATVTVAVSVAVVWFPCATTLKVPLLGPALIFA